MTKTVIKVEGLGKRYSLGARRDAVRYRTLRESLVNSLQAPWHRLRRASGPARDAPLTEREFWALRDVSFEIRRGEAVGIIGRNGAGKSTLLKVLSRITEPTTGRLTLRGRVVSLLEVGTGFHPELTGRENIFLNGAILGMSRAEIKARFDEIVAFAGVEQFLDLPVKRYSSGMYVRLAFAVAAHLEPEILVIDEVLAVGDAEFQKKCLGKLRDVAGGEGRTVLFVSHNMSAIQALCTRCILLREGRILMDGAPGETALAYTQDSAQAHSFVRPPQTNGFPTLVAGSVQTGLDASAPAWLVNLEVQSADAREISVDFRLHDALNVPVGYGSVGGLEMANLIPIQPGRNHLSFSIDVGYIAVGTYIFSLDLTLPGYTYYDRYEGCLTAEVMRAPAPGAARALSQSMGCGSFEIKVTLLD